jgi:FkbM family methyltransferase
MRGIIKSQTLFTIKVGKKLFYNTPIHRSKITNMIYKKLFLSAFGDHPVTRVKFKDSEFDVSTDDITILPSMLNGNYEDYLIEVYKTLLSKNDTIIDVGANIGILSIIGAKIVGEKGKVFAFEPVPENYDSLVNNIKLNRLSNINAVKKAVGEKKGKLEIYLAKNSIGTHSFIEKENHVIAAKEVVQVISLDNYLKDEKSIDVLKVDVEGFEPYVFRGATKTLQKTKYLLFEYNREDTEENYGIDNYINLLKDFNFFYEIDEKSKKVKKFQKEDFYKISYGNLLATKTEINVTKF